MELRTDYSNVGFQNNGKLKLLIIVGTRPEIIRLAAVINKCRKYFDCILAHTGQNYDYNLNGIFFRDLKLADPEVYMDAVGDDLGATMGNIINVSYKLMVQTQPDAVLVLGDTNSCLSVIGGRQPMQRRMSSRGDQPTHRRYYLRRESCLFRARKKIPCRVRTSKRAYLCDRFADGRSTSSESGGD